MTFGELERLNAELLEALTIWAALTGKGRVDDAFEVGANAIGQSQWESCPTLDLPPPRNFQAMPDPRSTDGVA